MAPSPAPAARGERGEETRQRLLQAAIDVFGRHGFEASTRQLAAAAGVNLAAIPYHFESKHGLYLAAAEHIAGEIRSRLDPALDRARLALAAPAPPDAADARALLAEILEAFARMMVDDASASWARFVIREQMEPSDAFDRLHGGFIGPAFATLAPLIARITGGTAEDERVRLQVPRLLGQILMLRSARATLLRELHWNAIGEAEFALIRDLIRTSVVALDWPRPNAREDL